MFDDKVLMITGGTGSFGSTVVRRFCDSPVREIRVFSRDEQKQHDMRTQLRNPRVKYYIGDVRNADSIMQAMTGVDFVFHAAALKQVPSCEFYPMEAVRTNILGTENVLTAAAAKGVKRVILLSTDKAVYPVNAMGMTKAMMEKLMVAKARQSVAGDTVLCATRYGNVMGSRGSVIPLLIEQIRQGLPITITDPNMTRFLMTLEDSVDLVMHAFAHGRQGDLFIQKAPACTLLDLATALKDLFEVDNPVHIIGTRHGEKLFESLLSREEMAKAEDRGRYFRIPMDARDLNYERYFTEGMVMATESSDYTSHNTERLGVAQLKALLTTLDCVRKSLDA